MNSSKPIGANGAHSPKKESGWHRYFEIRKSGNPEIRKSGNPGTVYLLATLTQKELSKLSPEFPN